MVRCAIWYHLFNSKSVKNTYEEVLLLVLKVTLLHGLFFTFLNCTNGTKSRKASQAWSGISSNLCFDCRISDQENISERASRK